MKTRKRLFKSAILLALLCLSSCAQTDTDDTADTRLPAGKYPMTFTTSVNELSATRATTDNTWDGGESVALQVGGDTKLYEITGSSPSSTLTSTDPFYWTSSDETKSVCGWYYGDGWSRTLKESYKLQENQSGTNGKDGYQMSDFLYAPAQEINFADNPKSLTFYHQTARVVINIVNAEAATDATQITDVAFGDGNNLALAGTYTAPDGNSGETFGTWTEHSSFSSITPKDITSSGSKYLKTYTALLIPQNMQGKKFIAITLTDGNTYYYTPKTAEDANFKSGMEYTYDVTVKYGHLEAVKVNESNKWDSNGTPIEVKSILAGFTADDLKIGDYYYSDGTTSDGGYRKYVDGTSEVLGILPVETSERHVIGIVYSTDVNRIGEAATKYLKDVKKVEPRGLVMALTNASGQCRWGEYKKDENGNGGTSTFQNNTSTLEKQYKNVDGYGETHWILNTYKDGNALLNTYTAFYHASRYGTAEGQTSQYAAPNTTTGWFIPSMGQWWDILSYLGGIDLTTYRGSGDDYAYISEAVQTAVNNMNKYLGKIGGATKFSTGTLFWSSSECSSVYACDVYFHSNGSLSLGGSLKDGSSHKVRCVFAY